MSSSVVASVRKSCCPEMAQVKFTNRISLALQSQIERSWWHRDSTACPATMPNDFDQPPPTAQPGVAPPHRFRAVQYVRMSTEHQQYSTQNQADKVKEYAEQRGIDIIRTYADEDRSGLRINGRAALQQLIKDATSGTADFSIILVYDVSRWGRFQDADESAFYVAVEVMLRPTLPKGPNIPFHQFVARKHGKVNSLRSHPSNPAPWSSVKLLPGVP